jgi:hypothetical protein
LEKRGVPTSTVISAAFKLHARLAAKNQGIPDVPILITPHPVNDLTEEQLREMAVAAFPVIVDQLTNQGVLPPNQPIDFVHPAARARLHCIAPDPKESDA